MENPLKYFAERPDLRVERNREHLLEGMLLISSAAVLSGAERWNHIAECGEDTLEGLKTFLMLLSGIPSHDPFNRVFAALDPGEMEKSLVAWARYLICFGPGSGSIHLIRLPRKLLNCDTSHSAG